MVIPFNSKYLKTKIFLSSFIIEKRDESTGMLFTYFMLETILLTLKINPYNQPSVELIKKETKKRLLSDFYNCLKLHTF